MSLFTVSTLAIKRGKLILTLGHMKTTKVMDMQKEVALRLNIGVLYTWLSKETNKILGCRIEVNTMKKLIISLD